MTEIMTVSVKNGRNWEVESTCTDRAEIYDSLAHELIAKKINACRYIRSIKRTQLYTGFIRIEVTYISNVRRTYTIREH